MVEDLQVVMLDLDAAIEQLIVLGEKDPLTIARKLEKRHGKAWVVAELSARREDLIAEIARHAVGRDRRHRESALTLVASSDKAMVDAEVKVAEIWIPGCGYKRIGECTAAEMRDRREMNFAFARGLIVRGAWCGDVADQMEAEGVAFVGGLSKLPPFPGIEDAIAVLPAARRELSA